MAKTSNTVEGSAADSAAVTTKRSIYIGGGKGGVGKSTLARALLDYYDLRGESYFAFDGDLENPSLSRFFDEAQPLASQTPEGFEAVVRQLETGNKSQVVADLGAGTQRHMADFEKALGLATAAKDFGFKPVLVFVLAPSKDSVGLLGEALKSHPVSDGWQFVIARAIYENGDWNIWEGSKVKPLVDAISPEYMDIPVLEAKAYTAIDKKDLRFKDAIAKDKKNLPYVESAYAVKWFAQMMSLFDHCSALAAKR
jgi:hypothetical protein